MAGETLKLVVEVAADQAEGALKSITATANQAGIAMKTSLLQVNSGARGAGEATGSLEKRVKALKGEMASGDRTINFFARSLNNIVPEASAAGQGLRLLADGLVGGLGLGLALQAVMAGLQLFGEHLKEEAELQKKAAEAAQKHAEELAKINAETERYRLQAAGAPGSFQEVASDRGPIDAALAEKREKVRQLTFAIEEADAASERYLARWREGGADSHGASAAADKAEATAESYRKQRDALQKEIKDLEDKAAAFSRRFQAAAGAEEAKANAEFWKNFNDEVARVSEELDKQAKAISDAYTKATNELLEAGLISAEKAAEKLRTITGRTGESDGGLFGIKTKGDLGPTSFTEVDFAGMGATDAAAGAAARTAADALEEIDKQNAEVAAQAAQLTQNIAASWIDALSGMLGETQITAKSMLQLFARLAAQMMAQATGSAIFGPLGGLAAALIGKALPSAAGGWDRVPSDTLAQIHKDEMVLSADVANGVRQMVAGGGAGGAPVNVTINAVDGPSVYRMIVGNGTDFARGMRDLAREGRI